MKPVSKIPSLASISTRAPSTNSLYDFDDVARSDHAQTQAKADVIAPADPAKRSISRQKMLKFGCAVALVWLWSRYIVQKSWAKRRWGPRVGGVLAGMVLSRLAHALGIKGQLGREPLAATCQGEGKRQALMVNHPHGQFLIGPLFVHAVDAMRRESAWNGVWVAAADVVFKVPFFRELVLLVQGRSASLRMVDGLLAEGKTVNIFPGGIHEQLATDAEQERCFFAPKLGFIREAIKHGVPLQPVYNFGENQQFHVPRWMRRAMQATGVPMGFPRFGRQEILVQPGRPVEVGPPELEPSEARVREIFRRYCAELLRLFDAHKHVLPPAVAARGLQLVWRGHEEEDLLAEVSGPADAEPQVDVASPEPWWSRL